MKDLCYKKYNYASFHSAFENRSDFSKKKLITSQSRHLVEPHDGPVERDVVLVEVVDGVLATSSFDTLLTMLGFGIFQPENTYDVIYYNCLHFKVYYYPQRSPLKINCPQTHCQ